VLGLPFFKRLTLTIKMLSKKDNNSDHLNEEPNPSAPNPLSLLWRARPSISRLILFGVLSLWGDSIEYMIRE